MRSRAARWVARWRAWRIASRRARPALPWEALSGGRPVKVFINNRDRLTWTRGLAETVAREPRCEVVIVDNASTYPPLLDWYEQCPFRVVRLTRNLGHEAPWESGVVADEAGPLYAVTDPDLDLSGVPGDWLDVLASGLATYPVVAKVGLSLAISDLPVDVPLRREVLEWEGTAWTNRLDERFWIARVDTTFALYAGARVRTGQPRWRDRALRAAPPYTARHLPWYLTSESITDEERYYLRHSAARSHWTRRLRQSTGIAAAPALL
jgi:hypothetical protein